VTSDDPIQPAVPPSGTGCVECLASGGWWFHLRRCARCGHIGCCDSSPAQHATNHYRETGHPVIRSFEPGEDWFWDYASDSAHAGPALAGPDCHPADQPTPGPAGAVPADWRTKLNR
jgi:ubiquitin-hydrolase Zn-finger-containing protein